MTQPNIEPGLPEHWRTLYLLTLPKYVVFVCMVDFLNAEQAVLNIYRNICHESS